MFMVDFVESMSFLLLHCPNLQQKLNFSKTGPGHSSTRANFFNFKNLAIIFGRKTFPNFNADRITQESHIPKLH